MTTLKSGARTFAKTPVLYKKKTGDAIDLEKDPEFGEFCVLSLTSRSNGRQEDVQQEWNDFETGIHITNVPECFRLMMYDHPQMKAAGYSLLGPTPIFDLEKEISISFFKLTEADQIDLPFAAVLLRLEYAIWYAIPDLKRLQTAHPSAKAARKSTARRSKRYSSSSEEEERPSLRKKKVGGSAAAKRW